MLKTALAVVAFITSVSAEPRFYGVDHLGLGRYGDAFIAAHPSGVAVGVFTDPALFGDPLPAIDEKLSRTSIPLVRYNLRFNNNHEYPRSQFPAIVREAKRVTKVVKKHRDVECEFAGAVEHKLSRAEAMELARAVMASVPRRCVYVNTPWYGKGALLPTSRRLINEIHDASARPPAGGYNFSFDGQPMTNLEAVRRKFRSADVIFHWLPQCNGRATLNDPTPRRKRRAFPDEDLILYLGRL